MLPSVFALRMVGTRRLELLISTLLTPVIEKRNGPRIDNDDSLQSLEFLRAQLYWPASDDLPPASDTPCRRTFSFNPDISIKRFTMVPVAYFVCSAPTSIAVRRGRVLNT